MSTLSSFIDNRLDPSGNTPITPDALSQPSQLSFIANDVASAAASAMPVAPTMAPPGAPFSAIYAFGDSLTDGGNDSLATAGLVPVSPPYADRSFTNGQVWVKDLAQDLGLPALKPSLAGGTDFAYGGAETGQTPAHTLKPTDLPSQISQFDSQVPHPQAGALLPLQPGRLRPDRPAHRGGQHRGHGIGEPVEFVRPESADRCDARESASQSRDRRCRAC